MNRARAAAVVLVVGCFHPTVQPDVPCSDNETCPDGQRCDTTQSPPLCVLADAGIPATADASDGSIMPPPPGGCNADAQCASGACDELMGTCVDGASVLYVATTGTNTGTCTRALPCATVSYALTQVSSARNFIAVGPGSYDDALAVTVAVTVSGPDDNPASATITLTAVMQPHVVEIENGIATTFEGLTVDGDDTGGNAFQVDNTGATTTMFHVRVTNGGNGGILFHGTATMLQCEVDNASGTGVVSNSGTATISRSWIHDNDGIGIDLRGSGQVVNTFVTDNGALGIDLEGGMMTGLVPSVSFSTIVDNGAAAGTEVGINCKVPALIDSSIIATNGDPPQVASACMTSYSLFDDTTPASATDISDTDPRLGMTYHLLDGSPAIDHANPAATLNVDYDGDMRPKGSGFDIGADEH